MKIAMMMIMIITMIVIILIMVIVIIIVMMMMMLMTSMVMMIINALKGTVLETLSFKKLDLSQSGMLSPKQLTRQVWDASVNLV